MLKFHPRHGVLLYCDFKGFRAPEMVKSRPVVVMSTQHQNLCLVVPLSGTAPAPVQKYHHKMSPSSLPERLRSKGEWWAKCDCISHVSFARLDRIKNGRNSQTGKREYIAPRIGNEDLSAIKTCVLHALGMSHLIPSPN